MENPELSILNSSHSDFPSESQGSDSSNNDIDIKDDIVDQSTSTIVEETDNRQNVEEYEELTEEELNTIIQIKLQETETYTLFSMPSVCVSSVDPNAAVVTSMNEKYTKLKDDKSTSDLYLESYQQTDGFPSKSKDVQVSPAPTKEMDAQATPWDIYESSNTISEVETVIDSGGHRIPESGEIQKEAEKEVEVVLASKGCLLDVNYDRRNRDEDNKSDGKEILQIRKKKEILNSEQLKKDLDVMDCIVQQNIIYNKLLEYRGIPSWDTVIEYEDPTQLFESNNETNVPSMDKLWEYYIPICQGYDVVDMCWNYEYPNLLAVGYGQVDYSSKKDGMVLFWSLKNQSHPLKMLNLNTPVSALQFSKQTPYLLAVGTYEGSVILYDIRREGNDPVLVSTDITSKHSEAIWKIKWIDMGSEKGEVLVTISSDSKVKEWNIKRGLIAKDLMTLKRFNNPNGSTWKPPEIKGDSLLPRTTGGCSFDFPIDDASIYFVGTEV